jgi:hypothetical protein
MKYRKLRIAWSVACGILCLLLVTVSIRSHGRVDRIEALLFNRTCTAELTWGSVRVDVDSDPEGFRPGGRYSGYVGINSNSRKRHVYFFARGGNITVGFPFWPLVLVPAMGAVVAWWRPKISFSLRTLLIGMTVIAAVLGLVIWAAK